MSTPLLRQADHLEKEVSHALKDAHTLDALELVRIDYLGRKGKLAQLMPLLKDLDTEAKRVAGPRLNELKQTVEALFATKKQTLEDAHLRKQDEAYKGFDVTGYTPKPTQGSLHLYTQALQELTTLFRSMGYEIVEGPEIETDYYNFEALNIPKDHPARDMQDTFWIDVPGMLLRTHTSNVQIHSMLKRTPPMALFSFGRVYRYEATDASHDCMFQQIEGLVVDKNLSMGNLLATLKLFLQKFFNNTNLGLRVRPGYFPFVEPGVEIDMTCPFCTRGCSVCKKTRWIEMLGAGLVHPHVLQAGGIDPAMYRGFAFGCGLTRLVMLKYGISDIRLLHNNKMEFLKQF